MLPDPSTSPTDDGGEPGRPGSDDYPPPEWPDLTCPAPGSPGPSTRTPGRRACVLSAPAGSFDADRFAQSGPAGKCRGIRCWPPSSTRSPARTAPGRRLTDDQLIRGIAAVRRLESRAAWYALSAVAEFGPGGAVRSPGRNPPPISWPANCT